MIKTASIIGVGLLLAASGAFAGSNAPSSGTATLATSSGILVRVSSATVASTVDSNNVYGAAINTAGVSRATTAVKVGGRVFLTAGRPTGTGETPLATVPTRKLQTRRPPRPQGLGAVLARIFGVEG